MTKNLILLVSLLALSGSCLADKVEPRWTTSVEAKGTSSNQAQNRLSASEVNVGGLEEDAHSRSIARGDRRTISKSHGNTYTQDGLNFADAISNAEQSGVGTTVANSELTSKFLKEGEEALPLQKDGKVNFERAGGFPTEISLSHGVKANNRVYRNSGSSALGKNTRSGASSSGSTILNSQTLTSENYAHGEKASTMSAGLGWAEGRQNTAGTMDSTIANGKNASVNNKSEQHSNSRASKAGTQSIANATRANGSADTASKTMSTNYGNGSAVGQVVSQNHLNNSATIANAKAFMPNYKVNRSA